MMLVSTYLCPPENPDDYRSEVDDDHQAVSDTDNQILIRLTVYFLKT